MKVIGFIVLGDRTSHGGTVISCSTNRYINGVRAARMGDVVMCPRCKRATRIITSRFPKSKDDGIPAAFDMDMTDCGARLYSRHNGYAGHGENTEASEASANEKNLAPASDDAPDVQEHFVLRDIANGDGLIEMKYTLNIADGRSIEGETDEQGRTNVVWTASPEDMTVLLHPQPGKSDDPYHFPEPASKDN